MSENIKSYLIYIEKYSRIVGIVMYVISVIFTCNLMLSFGSSGREKVLYLVFAIVIQSCQLISLGISLILGFIGNKAKSKMFFMAFVYLFILSLLGTVGFFAVSQRTQENKAFKTDVKYSEMQKQLTDYDKRIAVIDKQIESFASKGLMTKGVAPSREEKASLSAKRDKLSEEIKNYTPHAEADALYSSLSDFLDVPPDSLKLGLNFAYALILELMSAGLLWFSFFLKFQVLGNSIQPENYNKEENIKPYTTPAFVALKPATNQFSDRDVQIEFLINRLKRYENQEKPENTALEKVKNDVKQKINLNSAESLDNQYSATPLHAHVDAHAHVEITEDLIKAYVNALFSKPKSNGSLIGRNAIADIIGIDNKIAERIHRILKTKGLIKIDGVRTFAVCDKDSMLNAIIGNQKQNIAQARIGF